MIVFNKIRYKNFLSAGNNFTEINFRDATTTLIIGKNGGGKSTLIDALHYALYGKPFRNINKPQLVNSINRKDMLVELEFISSRYTYLIRRGMKPNVFEVYQDGVLINQNAEIKEYQDVLEKYIIKMSARTFAQIVVLGSRSYIPFMRLPTGQRREIIEDLLDIEMFSVMNVLLKDKINDNRMRLQNCQYQMNTLATQIELMQKHLDELKKTKTDTLANKQNHIESLRQKRELFLSKQVSNNEDIISKTKSIEDAASVTKKESDLRQMAVRIQTRMERLVKEIRFYTENDSCPTCKQGIAHEHKNIAIQRDSLIMAECEEGLEQLNHKLNALARRREEIDSIRAAITHLQQENAVLDAELRLIDNTVKSIESEMMSLKNDDNNIATSTKEIKEKKEKLKTLLKEVEQLNGDKQLYDVAAVLLKDTGIKTKIIRQYIPVINKLINKYLASMDFFVNFELNESFEETIKSRHRDEFTYASFSEGEKARLDIAILFTWRAIAKLRNSASTNLLILDEVFDGSLDTTGNEELLTIITDLASEANIFVISHRSEGMVDKFERTIRFDKSKNFSEMSIQ